MAISGQPVKRRGPVWIALFGVYLFAGALYSLLTRTWFPGFPPQLDVGLLFGGFGFGGIYVESALAALLGGVCIWASLRRANRDA